MKRVDENKEVIKIVGKATELGIKIDALELSILVDISASLAVIADALTEIKEGKMALDASKIE